MALVRGTFSGFAVAFDALGTSVYVQWVRGCVGVCALLPPSISLSCSYSLARVLLLSQVQTEAEAAAEAASIAAARETVARMAGARGGEGGGSYTLNPVAAAPVRQHNRVVARLCFCRVRVACAQRLQSV